MFTLFLMLVGFWGCIICCNILKQGCATNSQTEGLSTRTASKKSWRTEKNIDILDNSIFYLLLYRLLSLAQSTKLILLLYSTIYVYNKCLLHPNIFFILCYIYSTWFSNIFSGQNIVLTTSNFKFHTIVFIMNQRIQQQYFMTNRASLMNKINNIMGIKYHLVLIITEIAILKIYTDT